MILLGDRVALVVRGQLLFASLGCYLVLNYAIPLVVT